MDGDSQSGTPSDTKPTDHINLRVVAQVLFFKTFLLFLFLKIKFFGFYF